MNQTMLLALASVMSQVALSEQATPVVGDDVEEFFEVDVRRRTASHHHPLEFGARVYSCDHERNEHFMKKFGPIFKIASWGAVWEVSASAPAPISPEDDQKMKDWVDSVYLNLHYYMDEMKNTSKTLEQNGITAVSAYTNPPNTYYATPNIIAKLRNQTHEDSTEDGVKNEGDSYQMLISERIKDFANFWIFSIQYLEERGFKLPVLELADQPDMKRDGVHILPEDYVQVLKLVKAGLGQEGPAINGPGTSSPREAQDYIRLIASDKETYDAIQSWSFRWWDSGRPLRTLQKEIIEFRKFLKTVVPPTWPSKPITVEYGLRLAGDPNWLDGVRLAGTTENCYKRLYGQVIHEDDLLENTVGQSPAAGVRLLADLFLLYSHGVRSVLYESLFDHNWSFSCAGFFDRKSRSKQHFVALSSFLQHLDENTSPIRRQWKNADDCIVTGMTSQHKVIFGIANSGSDPCSRSFSLVGLSQDEIREAFSESYNNGSVSLSAEDASRALINRLPLAFDAYDDVNDAGDVTTYVEFDVTLTAHASTTLVFELASGDDEATVVDETEAKADTKADANVNSHQEL